MKKVIIVLFSINLLVACKKDVKIEKSIPKQANPEVVIPKKYPKMAQLEWLIGNWINDASLEKSYENWTKVNDTMLKAHSYTLLGLDTIFAERIVVSQVKDEVFLTVNAYQEKKDQIVTFQLVHSENNTYHFQNPIYDYPQSIVYSNPVKDSLHAWIEGTVDNEKRRVDFLFKKVN